MTLALLFSGQGTQHAAALPWLHDDAAAAPVLKAMAERLGGDWRQRLGDVEWASRNRVAQLVVTGTGLAAFAALAAAASPGLVDIAAAAVTTVVAGYSVGELAAFAAAGVFSFAAALDLAERRAAAMDRVVASGPACGLSALADIDAATLAEACRRFAIEVAIDLGPGRCIVGGTTAALGAATDWLGARGATPTPLAIHVPSHTSRLRPAAAEFARAIEAMPWQAPRTWIVTDASGTATRSVGALRRALAAQIASTVRWNDCIEAVAERRPSCVLELGGGTTLARLWQARQPQIPARSADEFGSAEAVLRWVESTQGR